LKIENLLDSKILEMPESLNVDSNEIRAITQEILRKANHSFIARNEAMHIIDEGEASCLALSKILDGKNIENMIAIDERTTRVLGEKPENLQKLFERKFHTGVKLDKDSLPSIKNAKFIRSSEIVYVAWKKSIVNLKDSKALDALLYATKFKGTAISFEEINELKKL